MRPLEAQSTAFKSLPPARGNPRQPSLVLFYAYREPAWTAAEHSRALKTFIKLCEAHDLKGRGRCAPEGVNCTLTGGQRQIRGFCTALREWDSSLFGPVDFKITDGLQKKEAFKRLTIRKTEELVGYGLGQAQPQLATSKATHLDAVEYHKALEYPDAIVVDVRSRVEINQCVGCTRYLFTKSFLGDDVAVLAPSSGEEPASPRHRAGVASMASRSTRRFSTKAL